MKKNLIFIFRKKFPEVQATQEADGKRKDKVTGLSEKLSVNNFVQALLDQVSYWSRNQKEFKIYRAPSATTISTAKEFTIERFIRHSDDLFKCVFENSSYYLQLTPNYHYETFNFISCQCIDWNVKYVCKHAIALSILFNFRLKGFSKEQTFNYQTKKGGGRSRKPS